MSDGKDDSAESDKYDFADKYTNETDTEKRREQEPRTKTENNFTIKTRSPLWYELPLLFAIVGGLIAYFKIKNDDPRKARNCLLLGALLTVPMIIVLGLFSYFAIPYGTENPFYVVSSASMEPNLRIFDVVVVQGNFPFNNLKVGDIIAFNRPSDHDKVIVHRVTEILKDDPLTFRTKGDANPGSIPGTDFPVTQNDYVGKVTNVIPQMGYVTRILTPPITYIVQFGILIVPILLHFRYRKSKTQSESKFDSSQNNPSK